MKKLYIIVLVVAFMLPLNVFANENAELEQGQGTVREAVKNGNKEFYTITTPSQKTYYLVVDFDDKNRNVYFLKAVDDIDLLDLAGVGEVIYTPEETRQPTTETTTESTTEEIIKEEIIEEDKPKVDLTLILGSAILIGSIVMIIINKKKQKNNNIKNLDLDYDEENDDDKSIFDTSNEDEILNNFKNKNFN